jgi:Flp pilus assembly pilin Flp
LPVCRHTGSGTVSILSKNRLAEELLDLFLADGKDDTDNGKSFEAFMAGRRRQDLVEYGLLLVLVSLGAVAAMGTLASAISNAFGNASSNLSSS